MNPVWPGAVVVAAVTLLSATSPALAHGWAGERFFFATILPDDPFVADEMPIRVFRRKLLMRRPRPTK